MIKIENAEVVGWEHAIRGMRNPLNSWHKSDSNKCLCNSKNCYNCQNDYISDDDADMNKCHFSQSIGFSVGNNDLELMTRLSNAGTDHRKFMRMIVVYADITAPLYWWKEYDTYKVGTVANSCSTMHKITSKPIELSDFSIDDFNIDDDYNEIALEDMFINVVADCEELRKKFIETKDKKYWKGLIQLLPSSYNQRRTVMLNYEVLRNMYHSRKSHKLDEWHTFCDFIEQLPYAKELIING